MQVTKITGKHIDLALEILGSGCYTVALCNKALEIALAEQEELENEANESINQLVDQDTQEQYITADEARALGAGNAEYRYRDPQIIGDKYTPWQYCAGVCEESTPSWEVQYRAIRKEVPAEPHAELKAMYAQQVKDGTLDDFIWSQRFSGQYESYSHAGEFYPDHSYHCTPKPKKQVSWKDMPVGVMTNKGELLSVDNHRAWTLNELRNGMSNFGTVDLELAPASEQPWFNWRGGDCPVPEGCEFEFSLRKGKTHDCDELDWPTENETWKHVGIRNDIIEYRITGIAQGYELK